MMKDFFAYIRREQRKILAQYGGPVEFCQELLAEDGEECLPDKLADVFSAAEPDERDYAIASAYSLLIGEKRRRELSAFFTPPMLSRAVLEASADILDRCEHPRVLDPACGGGSFLTPVVRHLIGKGVQRGLPLEQACEEALGNLHGIEIDSGLATLSQTLLRSSLAREFGFTSKRRLTVVRCADALDETPGNEYDLVVGNPPYGKIGRHRVATLLKHDGPANMGGHTNLYALFLLRGLGWLKPGGGLVFVLPTSFVAGPYFASLREEVLKRAEVVRIDLHEQRENLFLGAVQDVCVLTLRRRDSPAAAEAHLDQSYQLGVIDAKGALRDAGTALARGNGEPWILPVAHEVRPFVAKAANAAAADTPGFTLTDYGYRVRVGKVVPTRERERLHRTRQKGDLPLLWASTIRMDGSFDFTAPDRFGNARWYSPPDVAATQYCTRRPSVLLQRTSNRDQVRRLNAAAVPPKFREKHKRGFVAENHVIVIEALGHRVPVPPGKLARLLNSGVVNERFSAVCGSFSVSAKLLERLALPKPSSVSALTGHNLEAGLRSLCAGIKEILVLDVPRDAEHTVNQAGDLRSSAAVQKCAGLKRRAVA
jgi:adenine-specific DNA-methyltransferase